MIRTIWRHNGLATSVVASLFWLSLALPVNAEQAPARLIIIIDDIGNNLEKGTAAINLPGPIAYSVLPHTPHSVDLAELAFRRGKEVMLHAPMANAAHLRLGPGALTDDLNRLQLEKVLRDDIAAVPHVSGVNNHMGSLLTQRRQKMDWVMGVLAEEGLFFLDSRTTSETVAWKSAYSRGIPWLMRDVFLDHEQTTAFVDKQFRYGIRLAQEQGFAVLIGHPYPVTLRYLAQALPNIGEQGIQLVAPSGFLLQQAEARRLVEAQQRADVPVPVPAKL
ncbi:divergent polysaccharide deacetylase family protein [Amphritea opalescens]|uniref:Divergent polysaccharide deacetylase family protein n=1 Tax=Amphritea opalescens TaxID=2490544 RepID=A0A430KNX3_9GAMM|nr:divergent polysaccharide deacetylase family protein [Amphritea opalescens]RTE65165.1 divergent polysaccharide deacetylase family protein [Amphritea opalescens]